MPLDIQNWRIYYSEHYWLALILFTILYKEENAQFI